MKLRTTAAILSWVLTAAWMVMIFLLSAQPATASSEVSSSVTEIVISLVVPEYETLPATQQQAILDTWHDPIRKVAHLAEYAVLSVLLAVSLVLSRVSVKRTAIIAPVVSLIYAISDELHQGFVEARGPGVGDVLIDLCGAVIGIAAFFAVYAIACRVYHKRKEKISSDT